MQIEVIQGEVKVNSVCLLQETESLIHLAVDCGTEFPFAATTSAFEVWLGANKNARGKGKEEGFTGIRFLNVPESFEVTAADAGKYEVFVIFTRRQEESVKAVLYCA